MPIMARRPLHEDPGTKDEKQKISSCEEPPPVGWNIDSPRLRKRNTSESTSLPGHSEDEKHIRNPSEEGEGAKQKDKKEYSTAQTSQSPALESKGTEDQTNTSSLFLGLRLRPNAVISTIILVLIVCFCYYYTWEKKPEVPVNVPEMSRDEISLEKHLQDVKKDFPSQNEDTWHNFLAGIKRVDKENPNKPSVFLLLHEDAEETANCLAKRVSLAGIEFLKGQSIYPLVLEGQELKTNREFLRDSGELIVQYNSSVYKKGGMVVTDLHEVPGAIAKSFHFFCDRESPLVDRAIYFFTLKYEGFSNKLQTTAELTLQNLWGKSLTENLLQPLITRLTGHTVLIKPESLTPNCDF